ncbi:hypothetical protein SAMN06265795_10738 [Noviherbaspirillum humi]|uniref:Lipoprotein n=1 Tax=Noviherbaspirillum humi TaxID=1688639 RepID=A0A239HL33_9BURK|nr:hypothetical protein [Noviherbaspirillum humi]SNS81865.1 hypothetical protein SAMN06265795_10738 [Noviherbaspirillum humi]
MTINFIIRSAIITLAGLLISCSGGGEASNKNAFSAPPSTQIPPGGIDGNANIGNQKELTYLAIQNTSATEQRNIPLTLGHPFINGNFYPTDSLFGKFEDGTIVPIQADIKATNANGSVRHAILSVIVPSLSSNQSTRMTILRTDKTVSSNVEMTVGQIASKVHAEIQITVSGKKYTASLDDAISNGNSITWLKGPIANEWILPVPLKDADGNAHPHLTVRYAVRTYNSADNVRIDTVVENNWAWEPAPQNFTYDAQIFLNGKLEYKKTGLTHFHHARWRHTAWTQDEPRAHIRHNPNYLFETKSIPNYDRSLKISQDVVSYLENQWNSTNKEPMAPGVVTTYMPTTGGRPDIGVLPQWSVIYLLNMDRVTKEITTRTGDLAGSWPIHYRDKSTGYPISIDDYPYITALGREIDTIDPKTGKSQAFPPCGGTCDTAPFNYTPDTNHQPSLAYVPYLVTGDYYYLEELQFWADWNIFIGNPGYRDASRGLVIWDQVRGQAWTLRTLSQAAYITPDSHPQKSYYLDKLINNLAWYTATYVDGNPNNLGIIDGTGKYAFSPMVYYTSAGPNTGIAPWQDDFFTWVAGYMSELGYEQATYLLKWKARFPVTRMVGAGYCWIDGATYSLVVRDSEASPIYSDIGQSYKTTMREIDGSPLVNSKGIKYLDLVCGSQAQADWRTQRDTDTGTKRNPWYAGEMDGFSDSPMGFPSNMQPALSVAVDNAVTNAEIAWTLFTSRTVKPDYATSPQWAVVPRTTH